MGCSYNWVDWGLSILRPGSATFQAASLLPLSAAFGYATLHMLTRYIGKTESAASMSFYIQLTFLVVCIISGLIIGDGKFSGGVSFAGIFI